jgi:hypothetical protein
MRQFFTRVFIGTELEHGLDESSFPQYQAQLRNMFHLRKTIAWWTSLRRVAGMPANDHGGGVIPAYTEFDMSLAWAAGPTMDFSLSGHNLLNASHPEIGGLAARREIERSAEASVRLKF